MTTYDIENALLRENNTDSEGNLKKHESRYKRVENIKNATHILAHGYIALDRITNSMICIGKNNKRYLYFSISKMPHLYRCGRLDYTHELSIPASYDAKKRGEMEYCIGNMIELKVAEEQNYEYRVARSLEIFNYVLKEVFYNCEQEEIERAKKIFMERIVDI